MKCIINKQFSISLAIILLSLNVSALKKAPAPWRVLDTKIVGNNYIKTYTLLNLMELKPILFKKKPRFSIKKLNSDLQMMHLFYVHQGFLNASVKCAEIKRDSTHKKVSIHLSVNEGQRTLIASVLFSGLLPDSQIIKKMKCRMCVPFISSHLTHDEQLIRRWLKESGYLYSSVVTGQNIDSDHHRAEVTFRIKKGPLFTVDTVFIDGVQHLKPTVIQRELSFEHGDTLTAMKIRKTEQALYRTNLLNSVIIEPIIHDSSILTESGSNAYCMPIRVRCRESHFFRLKIGAGYGSEEKLRGSVEASYNNLFRLGHHFSLKGNVSQLLQQVQAIYSTPWVFNIPLRFYGKLYYNRYSDTTTFQGEFRGVSFSLEKSVSQYLKAHLISTYEDVVWITAEQIPEDLPIKNTQSIGFDVVYDTRNNLMDAEKGLFSTSAVEWAGLTGENSNQFIKITEDVRYYWIWKWLRFATSCKIGWVYPYGNSTIVPLQNQFFAGGSKSVRGYRDNFLRTDDDSLHHAKSGNVMVTANCLEIRFPIYGYLHGALFSDVGYLDDHLNINEPLLFFKKLRWTTGGGVRIKTPIAILRMDCGFKLNRKSGEDLMHLHFDVGQAF